MPSTAGPTYRSKRSQLRIDRCEPQIAAMAGGKIDLRALAKGHYPGTRLKPFELPGVSSIGFMDGRRPQDRGLEPHRNEGLEIGFLETGTMNFTVEARHFELHSGNLTVTRPWQLHKLGAPNLGSGRFHWLILDLGERHPNHAWRWPRWVTLTAADRRELTRILRHNGQPVWHASTEVAAAFRGLGDGVRHWGRAHGESRMLTLLNQLLLGVLITVTETPVDPKPEHTSRLQGVETFLREFPNSASRSALPWTLPQMAAHCGMGITAFSKYCRELVNTGPVAYLNQARLDHAAAALQQHPEKPITQIAFENGFNSSQYFATAFRKRFGVTPGNHRPEAVAAKSPGGTK